MTVQKIKPRIAATLVALTVPTMALAQFTSYGTTAGWNVFHDGNAGGCFMEQQQGDLVVQMGVQSAPDSGFVAVYAAGDVGIAQDEPIQTTFRLDGEEFGGTSQGVNRGDLSGAFIRANNPDFLQAIRGKQTMAVTGSNGGEVSIDLTGTNAAVDTVIACIEANAG